jgi:site-specific DNA recombinase
MLLDVKTTKSSFLIGENMQQTSTLKFALYARKSSESEDRQVQSIDDQINIMTEQARRDGLTIKLVLSESRSAKKPNNRPEFRKLLEMIKRGEIDAVLCWQINRLSRNPQESGEIQQLLQDEVLKCIQTNDRMFLSDDNAIIFSVESSMANQYVRDLVVNVRRGMYSKAERGWLPGKPPIGYKNDRENRTIVVDEERFGLVRQMWDLMLLGNFTVSEITRIADSDWGLRSIKRKRSGDKPLSISAVYTMFQNLFYVGYVPYVGKLNAGKHTPMVTQQEFDHVQTLIKHRNNPRPVVTEEADPFPYRGLIRCGECGCLITYSRKVKTQKNGNVHTFEYCYCTRRRQDYICTQRQTISPQELTKRIRDEISKYTIMDDFFKWACRYLDEFNQAEVEKQQQVYDSQVKTIKAIEDELRELNRMRYRNQVDDEFYESEKQALENRLVVLRGVFNDQEEQNKRHRKHMDKYFNFARYAKEDFEGEDDRKRKEVLSIIGQNLLFKDGVTVFEPIKYLIPLVEKYPELEKRYKCVGTYPEQRREEEISLIISEWYAWQDSNLRPLAPQANALSS